MFKIKLLVGLAGLMTTLLVVAAPAMAEFESNGAGNSGPIKTFPEKSTFQSLKEGPTVECKAKNAEGVKIASGEWQIQVKTYTQQGKFFYQAPAHKGPHEQLKIDKWGVCTGPTGIATTVQCALQVEIGGQNGNAASAVNGTGSVVPPGCFVIIGTPANNCTITVPQGGNRELQGVTIKNLPANEVEIKSNIENRISSTFQESKELCKTLGLNKNGQATGSFKTGNEALITEGQKLV
jgi:hypothetical protein